MDLVDLAFDLQLQILQLCSHNDLAVLSRVHTSLRDPAEYILYKHIYLPERDSIWWSDPELFTKRVSLVLSTLSRNAQKALMVKTF